jgi:hypothetical protein
VRENVRRRIRARSRKKGFPLREEIGRLVAMSGLARSWRRESMRELERKVRFR